MMMNNEPQSTIFGVHEFQFVPPDTLRFFLRGEFGDSDCEAYLDAIFQRVQGQTSTLYAIYDLTQLTRVAEGARKRLIHVKRAYPYGGIAVMVSTLSMRAVVEMMMRAGKLVAADRFGFPYKFVKSVEEADAWFDELRKKGS